MAKFQDVPVNQYFKLEQGGRSFLKTSAFGYYLDPVMGEMQVQGKLEVVYPIVVPVAPGPAKTKAPAKPKAPKKSPAKKKPTKK